MTDYISRQAAITSADLIIKRDNSGNNVVAEAMKAWKEYIQSLPSAQPHWIPCSERLPDKPNIYTVTDSKGDVVRFVFYDNESSREYWRRCAKAWMSLPEPYQERQEE